RVHQSVERGPLPAQLGEERSDLRVARDVTGEDERASELRAHFRDAVLEAFVLVGERELRALAPGGFGDPVGDRAIGEQARDQHALSSEEARCFSALVVRVRGIVADSLLFKSWSPDL